MTFLDVVWTYVEASASNVGSGYKEVGMNTFLQVNADADTN